MATKAMTRSPGHRCSECGWSTVKWVGRCGECQAWGTVSEIGAVRTRTTAAVMVDRPAVRIGEVDARQAEARTTGVSEFDRVLGGGLVRGAVVLVAGEPGIGKSTLVLDVAARAARQDQTVLYVTGEESASQVRMRAERIEAICRRHGVPLAAAALQFPLAHPLVAAIIPGAHTVEVLKNNLALMRHVIPSDLWTELKAEGLLRRDAPSP